MQTSKSIQSDTDYRQAEKARRHQNRRADGIRFPSAKAALGWYFEMREKLTAPVGMHPRTQTTRSGQEVIVRVDGGRGGDLDEVMATMMTIGVALKNLEGFDARGYRIVMLTVRDGKTQGYTAKALGISQSLVSRLLGRALDTVWTELK